MEEDKKYRKGRVMALGIAMGIPLGLPIGLAMGNLAVGPAIGLVLGAGIGFAMEKSYRNREEVETGDVSRKKKKQWIVVAGILGLAMLALLVIYMYYKSRS